VAFNVSVKILGLDETIDLLVKIPGASQRKTLEIFRDWGEKMVFLGEILSPQDPLRGIDPRRTPEEESLSRSWRFEVEPLGKEGAELRVGNVRENLRFIIEGTQAHPIPSSPTAQWQKGYPMTFVWPNGPQVGDWASAWYIQGGVAAYGTPEHPVHEEILDKMNLPIWVNQLAQQLVWRQP
jgi:hypothetical protein